MELQRASKNVPGRSIVIRDMTTRRPARPRRRVAVTCLVLLVTTLGFLATTMVAPSPAGARPAQPDLSAESPTDEPTAGRTLSDADLPRTTTGSDGFVVLGVALVAITAVALVMALRNRSLTRISRRPAGWAHATGRGPATRTGPPTSVRISPRSRYSSRSRR
jgi:hypothetical protein